MTVDYLPAEVISCCRNHALLPLQLMGSFVLAVGLWLRFDPETVSLLNVDKAPDTFFIGEYHDGPQVVAV